MPKYSNTNGFDVAIGCIRVPARCTIETTNVLEQHGSLPAGISRVADLPLSNDVLISDKDRPVLLATPKTYAIPLNPWKQTAFIVCSVGAITVSLSTDTNTPLRVMKAGSTDTIEIYSDKVDNIVITSTVATSKIDFDLRKA